MAMLTSKMKKIISKLESEMHYLENQIDSFINSCDTKENHFVREEDLFHYSNLMGKMMFLNDCINNIKSSFVPGEDCYEQDKEDYGNGFDSYYRGQLESFELYLSIIKSCS